VSYIDFVNKEIERIKITPVLNLIKSLKGKKVLCYSHDDPDGLTSAVIFTRLLKKLQIDYELKIPTTMELEEDRLKKDLKEDNYEAVFVLDKATMGYYDKYVEYIKNFVVIDHHPLQGENLRSIFVVNPQIHGDYKSCSTSFLVHMIAENFESTEDYDDFLALVGLKGDWAVEPATDIVSDYVSEFYKERVSGKFNNLVKKIRSQPTMFEVKQIENTTLLNQITELYFALGGGGFQYFYNDRDERLRDINQPEFSFEIMEKEYNNFNLWKSLDDFINATSNPEIVNLLYGYFLRDWENTIKGFSSTALLTTFGNIDTYLFLGYKVSLMPMTGSVYLSELKKESAGKEVLFIMINRELNDGIHFSIRATSAQVHAGKICGNLAKRLVAEYNHNDQITGGGHPFAAECRTRKSGITLAQSLKVFAKLIMDMEEVENKGGSNDGEDLGMEYLR
jgi:hypothetical protein